MRKAAARQQTVADSNTKFHTLRQLRGVIIAVESGQIFPHTSMVSTPRDRGCCFAMRSGMRPRQKLGHY
jgi:hypothetical protein